MVCANKAITKRYIVAKKHSTKRSEAQQKLWQLHRQKVNYFEVPKPLWKRIKPLLPKPKQRDRPPLSNRLVLNAVWYVLWTSCQWKALSPAQFGVSSSTAHERFQICCRLGIFEDRMAEMVRFYDKKRKIRWKWQAADGKNCPAPLGGEETRPNPTGRCKSGSEIHPLVDRSCTPSVAHLSTYIRHGKCSLQALVLLMVVERPDWKQHLCLDRGYDPHSTTAPTHSMVPQCWAKFLHRPA
jgi:transposase